MITRFALACVWLLHFLPLTLLAPLGQLLGMLLYALGRERRSVCLINLRRCFPEVPERGRRRIARAHFRAVGRSLIERGIQWWAPRRRLIALVRVSGIEHIESLRGRPLVLLVPHFVGLDMGFARLACVMDLAGIYAVQKNRVIAAAMLKGRSRFGRQRLFSRQDGVRPALSAIRQGLPFYYLPDQDYGARDAIFVPFFSVPAATITGLSRLAKLTGAAVVPCVTRMLEGGRGYALTCYPAWEGFPTDDVDADTRRMNAFIEERVREMPEQYFWSHKRFKTRPAGEARWY